MGRFLIALFAATAVAAQATQLGDAAPSTAQVFWRAMLPDSPLPDTILRLLRPGATLLNKIDSSKRVARDLDYKDYSSKGVPQDMDYDDYNVAEKQRAAAGESRAEKHRGATAGEAAPFGYDYKAPSENSAGGGSTDSPFSYDYKKAPSKRQAGRGAGDSPFAYDYKKTPSKREPGRGAGDAGSRATTTTTVFFHEEALRVGERLPFRFPPATTTLLGLLPRHVADSIPFSTAALPGVLALLGVAPGSAAAASMAETLRACEAPTIAGEAKFCATSLEALVEGVAAVLGTRDVRALTSALPRAGAPLQRYTVRAVRPVEGGASFVACHDEAYPYAVYRCHTTGPTRAYMVEMEGGAGVVTVATVCHTDTSHWNPDHLSFKLLGAKPGGAPICHLMPYGHMIWAKNVNVKRAPA